MDQRVKKRAKESVTDTRQSKKRNHAMIAGAVPLAFGAICAVEGAAHGVGTLSDPKPGMWPVFMGLFLVIISVLVVVTDAGEDSEDFTRNALYVLMGFGLLGGFIVLFGTIGVIPALFSLWVAWLRVLYSESWLLSLLLALIFSFGLYVLFAKFVGVPFPSGIIEF